MSGLLKKGNLVFEGRGLRHCRKWEPDGACKQVQGLTNVAKGSLIKKSDQLFYKSSNKTLVVRTSGGEEGGAGRNLWM